MFADWKAWIFRDLPFEHLVRDKILTRFPNALFLQIRVVDCLLYEGQKVLFRCALGLMISYYRARKAQPTLTANGKNDVKAVAEDIASYCRSPHIAPAKLIKVEQRTNSMN